jgi:hypothetical protein
MKSKRWLVVGLAIGCVVGGLVGSFLQYTLGTAPTYRKLLKEYRYVRDNFHMTDAEMAEMGPKIPQYFEDVKRQDELAAVMALGAFRAFAKGDIEDTKAELLRPIGGYYYVYHENGGDPDLIARIKEAARDFPEIAAEISRTIKVDPQDAPPNPPIESDK